MAGQKQRRTSSYFPDALYVYLETENKAHAKGHGKKVFGSHSAYINALIAKDRGVKPKLGFWKAKGEATKKRLALEARKKREQERKQRQKTERRNAVS